MPKHKALPPLEDIKQQLVFNSVEGRWFRLPKQRETGNINTNGYCQVYFNGNLYLAHRLAWLWCHRTDPGALIVDHVNGNKLDNRISNLRLATYQQSSFNRRVSNKLGFKGVTVDPSSGRSNRIYLAQIRFNGINYKLGRYATPAEAHKEYMSKAFQLFGDFCVDPSRAQCQHASPAE